MRLDQTQMANGFALTFREIDFGWETLVVHIK